MGAEPVKLSGAGQKVELSVAEGWTGRRQCVSMQGGGPGPWGKCVRAQARGPRHTHASHQLCWLLPQAEGVMSCPSPLGGGGVAGRQMWGWG